MSQPESDNSDREPEDLDLAHDEDGDAGFSLDMLSAAYAEALGTSDSPYESSSDEGQESTEEDGNSEQSTEDAVRELVESEEVEDDCELSPRTILEAILFVGSDDNEPLTTEHVASKMRGVQADEVTDLIAQLNQSYLDESSPYEIVASGTGYRMSLREEFAGLREKFYGKVREAKLSQPAIDVLSLVAYNQGLTKDEADDYRGKGSGPLLNQLIRRQLVRLERETQPKKVTRYFTTERFLAMFHLSSLEDLPQPQGMDLDD
ncbi:MAG: SMC-Scp complex subunit ScpB [Pirellulales bacterium]